MEYTVNHTPGSIVIMMTGQLTFQYNQKFKEIINLLKTPGLSLVLINFRNVEFIDSAGLGMLLLLRDQCNEKGITVKLTEPQGQVEKIFTLSKFDQLFGNTGTEH